MVVARAWGGVMGRYRSVGAAFQFGKTRCWRWMVAINGGTPMIIHLMPINCTLKVVTMTKFMAYMSYQNKKQTLWFV